MENKFKDYVTSTAFSLTLSRPMIECLCQLDQLGSTWLNIMTYNALENRGLVMRNIKAMTDIPPEMKAQLSPVAMLTDAGKALMPLLKIAGLYVHYEVKKEGNWQKMPSIFTPEMSEEYHEKTP